MRRKVLTAVLIIATAACSLLSPLPAYASQGTDTVIAVNVPYVDNLSSWDEVDVFRFSIPEPGSLQVRFEFPIGGEYTVEIFQITTDKGPVSLQRMSYYAYTQSVTGRYTKEGYKIRVPKGDYIVKVGRQSYGSYSSDNYVLTVKYTAEPGNDYEKEFNNEAKYATLISTNAPCTGNLNDSDDIDFYNVKLPSPGSLQIKLEYNVSGDYNVEVFELDSLNNLSSIQRSRFYSSSATVTGMYTQLGNKLRVPAGDYYIKVSRQSYGDFCNSDYVLTVNYKAEPGNEFEKEPNNSARDSTFIGCNTPCTGNLSDSDDIDFYRVKLLSSGSLQVKLEYNIKGDYNVEVFELDSLNNLSSIQKSYFNSSSATVTGMYTQLGNKLSVAAGDYYIKVSRQSYGDFCNGDYVLTILSDAKFAAPPDTRIIANPNKSTVLVNGKKIAFDSYNIDGYNYFKLRDLAQAINGTNKNFEVTWDGKRNAIFLYSNRPYTPVGNELKTSDRLTSKTANPNTSLIYVDGKVVTLTAYNIDGSNYFKLRDIAKLFDIGVTWNGNTKTIEINTYMPYVE